MEILIDYNRSRRKMKYGMATSLPSRNKRIKSCNPLSSMFHKIDHFFNNNSASGASKIFQLDLNYFRICSYK